MNICFNGCSLTVGEGFPEDQRDQYIYDRLLEKRFGFNRTNIARGGSSNYTIFLRSADAIMSGQYNCVITQWSALNRIWLYPGPDSEFFTNETVKRPFSYRDIYLSAEEKAKFVNTLLVLNGDYHNIIDLIKFNNILCCLAKQSHTKVVFINGLIPWQQDVSAPLGSDLNSCLSEYTKSLLDFDHRDDSEIVEFFQNLQTHFSSMDQSSWVNLFDSWFSNVQDVGPEGHHPGIVSHQWMADTTANFLLENKIL